MSTDVKSIKFGMKFNLLIMFNICLIYLRQTSRGEFSILPLPHEQLENKQLSLNETAHILALVRDRSDIMSFLWGRGGTVGSVSLEVTLSL